MSSIESLPTSTHISSANAANEAWEVVATIARRFEAGWNAGRGDEYVAPLAEDADYITILGLHASGRPTLSAAIQHLYDTAYKGSTIAIQPTSIRVIAPTIFVAQLRHVLDAPAGPWDGPVTTLATVVVVRGEAGWEVVALHNTQVVAPPQP